MADSTKHNIESSQCEVCTTKGKYRCPGCKTVTCSLACSKEHKKVKGCSGKEAGSSSKYVEKKNFDDSVLKSDFKFLEDTENMLDSMERANKEFGQFKYTPKFFLILTREAKKRGIHLLAMSNLFNRHKQNKSFYVISSTTIEWTVEWIFDLGEHKETFYQHKVLENSTIGGALKSLFESNQQKLSRVKEFKRSSECDLKVLYYHVKMSKGLNNRFEQVNQSQILNSTLVGKTVVEFPTFYVVLRRDWPKYLSVEDQQQPSSPQELLSTVV